MNVCGLVFLMSTHVHDIVPKHVHEAVPNCQYSHVHAHTVEYSSRLCEQISVDRTFFLRHVYLITM